MFFLFCCEDCCLHKTTYFLLNWGIRIQLTIIAGPRAPPSVSSTSQRRTQNKSQRQCGDCSTQTQKGTNARELLTRERPKRTQIQVVPGPEKKGPPGSPALGGKVWRRSSPMAVEHRVEKVVLAYILRNIFIFCKQCMMKNTQMISLSKEENAE